MSHALLIIYDVEPDDPQAFYDYYTKTHLPIAKTFPKLRKVEVDMGVEDGYFMLTRLIFDSLEDLKAAAVSPEREKAKADMANFPAYKGEVQRKVVEIQEF
jgi:uncharacterized protein (TIGR02118 family)